MSEDIKTTNLEQTELSAGDLPFEICQEERRKFVRIEFSAPISIKNLMEMLQNQIPFEDLYQVKGEILNISECGMLVETESMLEENDLVLIKLMIQGEQEIDNVVGLVKRSEFYNEISLAGIEFMDVDKIQDKLSQSEYELLAKHIRTFENSLYEAIQKYIAVN